MCEDNRTLWVGNLSPEVDEELLFELFLQAGPLDKVTIPKGSNGYSRGYGFVTFKHECSVLYAIALMKGIVLFGKRILPQLRLTDHEIPNHKKRASLDDNRRFPFRSPRSPYCGSAFRVYQIPVLGASHEPAAVGNEMVPPMPQHGVRFVPPWPQYMIPQYYEQNFHRRRTHHGFPYNTQFGMGNPWYSTPMMPENNSLNIVLFDNNVNGSWNHEGTFKYS